MERVHRAGAVDAEQFPHPVAHPLLRRLEGGVLGADRGELGAAEVVAERCREDEVAVGQALHQRRGAEAVGAVIGEVGLADDVEPRDGALQVVVHPGAAHRVVDRGVDAHRALVGVLPRDALVHLEEVAVAFLDLVAAESLDGIGEVEEDPLPAGTDPAPLVAHFLRRSAGDVARRKVAEGGVFPLEVVVALRFRDLLRRALVPLGLGHPDATVIPERFRHQRQLRLVVAALRDAGGVDLGVAGIGEGRALLPGAEGGGDVAPLRVGREEEYVAVATGAEDHGVGGVARDLAGDEVAHHDAAGDAVDHHEVEHLGAREHRDRAGRDLALERLVGADQELLPRLAAGVEGPAHLGAAEGAVVEEATVLACQRYPLRHGLVDDLKRDLGQAVDVRLAGAEVAPLHRVVEEALDAVAIVPIVLGGVDPSLRGDRVRPAGGVLETERLDVVPLFAEGRGRRGAGQAGPDDDDGVFPAVGRAHQLHLEAVTIPLLGDRAGGGVGFEFHESA